MMMCSEYRTLSVFCGAYIIQLQWFYAQLFRVAATSLYFSEE